MLKTLLILAALLTTSCQKNIFAPLAVGGMVTRTLYSTVRYLEGMLKIRGTNGQLNNAWETYRGNVPRIAHILSPADATLSAYLLWAGCRDARADQIGLVSDQVSNEGERKKVAVYVSKIGIQTRRPPASLHEEINKKFVSLGDELAKEPGIDMATFVALMCFAATYSTL